MYARRSPFIIAFVGVVGSGKTYLAKILARRLRAKRITTDDIRVALRERGESYDSAPTITRQRAETCLRRGQSVILDFDAINPDRDREFRELAQLANARLYRIEVRTSERLIIVRLRRKTYTPRDLFRNAEQAIRVYFQRNKFRKKFSHIRANFTVQNDLPLEPQINKIVKHIHTGL